jgi:hypothetical protein
VVLLIAEPLFCLEHYSAVGYGVDSMPFEGIKIHAKFVSSLRAERSNDRRDIFNSHKNSMNRKSPNFIKVNTLAVGAIYQS